jgi:hypothetical protein
LLDYDDCDEDAEAETDEFGITPVNSLSVHGTKMSLDI